MRKRRKDLSLAFPGKGKEIEHDGMNSPLHPHVSSLILSTCDQIQHFIFIIWCSSLNSVRILELLESCKVAIFESVILIDFFKDREAIVDYFFLSSVHCLLALHQLNHLLKVR